jgi:predicted PurR-regulated permease PerM
MKLHPPTLWQQKAIYAALTALSLLAICWVVLKFLLVAVGVISFLQPLLIPFAVAGVLAYLLEPVVQKLDKWKLSRTSAVLVVFGTFVISTTLIFFWIVPELYQQSIEFGQKIPDYIQSTRKFAVATIQKYQQHSDDQYFQNITAWLQDWLQKQLPGYTETLWKFVRGSFGGVLGVFGYILGLLIIPLYLFYFLKESTEIQKNWSDYLPLQASHFKDEVVATLTEINGYLIAFFRGQLIVSIVDGVFIGLGLLLMQLKFGPLIGLMVAVLALIPYLGVFICWIPAVIIAGVQFQDWQHPLIVTAIFIGVNQIEGWLLAPKIVGDSVGLHPLTVIASVLGWSLLLGGLLGAILAVPLTATLKVLLRRYVWHRTFTAKDESHEHAHAAALNTPPSAAVEHKK